MAKIVCFEGTHGVGKGTVIDALIRKLDTKYAGKYAILRDSEYPEFERVKQDIRAGNLASRDEIIEAVAKTREQVYSKYMYERLKFLDLAILDRSYYTSAVWQSESDQQMYEIIHKNESRDIPRADLTLILIAEPETVKNRLKARGRTDLTDAVLARVAEDQRKYRTLAQHCKECVILPADRNASEVAIEAYNLIMATIAR